MVFGDDDFPCDAEEEAAEEAAEEEEEEEEADGPEVDPKTLKAIVKEGGKKGAEVAGAADMGGMTHMNVSLDLPEGRTDMMLKALEAMNVEIDPAAEETKGGAGHVAKALFSYGPDRVGVVCYVPKELQDRVTADVWAAKIVESMGGEIKGKATAKLAKGFVLGDAAKELYPIKMKDELLKKSITFLQEIGVFPDKDDDDSDDEMVFGDDDFPCDADEEAAEEEEEEEEADGPEVDPKALKAIVKEGGKKGAEVAGAADMGGMTHMNVSLDLPEGRTDMMLKALEAMNVDVDPMAEETKGGAGHVAKALFSYGTDRVGVVVYVPAELEERVAANVWAQEILAPLGGELKKGANAKIAKGFVLGDAAKDLYPIKMKDTLLQNSIAYLQKIGVFPSGDSDEEDEMVFGDDDFPCDQEEEAVEEEAE